MKTNSAAVAAFLSSNSSQNEPPPPIPLIKNERPSPKKGEYTEFKLYTNPTDVTSQTFTVEIRTFKQGDPEDWIETLKDIEQVCRGTNMTLAEDCRAMVRTILKGEALRIFEDGVFENHCNDMDQFDLCIQHVTTHLFPTRALVRQKRYMRRHMRKNREMSIRSYII